MNHLDLSIVIVTYRSRDVIDACLIALERALAGAPRLRAEVLLLDACSGDGVLDHVRSAFPRVRASALTHIQRYSSPGATTSLCH